MTIESRESGLALIVTLLLGLIAAGFVGAMMYVLGTGNWISGMEARYTSALQAAKGGTSYITQELGNYNLNCDDGQNTCLCYDQLTTDSDGKKFQCPDSSDSYYADDAIVEMGPADNLGDYDIEAKLLSRVTKGATKVFTFSLTAESNINTEESAEIEFVYKVE